MTLLIFGTFTIISGLLISYLLLTSVINLSKSIENQYSYLSQIQKNKINSYGLIGAMIVLIGTLIVREAFKR